MKERKLLAILLFGMMFIAAIFFVMNGKNFIRSKLGRDRNPAAIPKTFDFSNLKGDAFATSSKKRLIQGAEIVKIQGEIGLRLGHFLAKGTEGQSVFVCTKYDRIRLHFEAEGFAVGGEPASMTVETRCETSKDLTQIAPVWIPYSQILNEKPGDFEVTYHDQTARLFQFKNVVDEWPHEWVLTGVEMLDPAGDHLAVDRQQIREILDRPLSLSWK